MPGLVSKVLLYFNVPVVVYWFNISNSNYLTAEFTNSLSFISTPLCKPTSGLVLHDHLRTRRHALRLRQSPAPQRQKEQLGITRLSYSRLHGTRRHLGHGPLLLVLPFQCGSTVCGRYVEYYGRENYDAE